mgnify:CR=1 FL=1
MAWGGTFDACLAQCVATKCTEFAYTNRNWGGRPGCVVQKDHCASPCDVKADAACKNWDTYTCSLPDDSCAKPPAPAPPPPPPVRFAVSPALAQRPVMERVTPSAGPPGTRVQIIGRHLGYRSQVFLGDVELPVHQRLPNRWTVEIPSGAPSGPILLRTNEGSYAGPFFRVTAARPAPAITGLEPAAAPPGSEVAILGQNFSARLGDNDVTLAGRRVVVRSATPTALRVILPSDATSGTFTVQVDGSLVPAESPRFEVTVGTSITAIEPPRAPPGAEVTLRGTGFSGRDRDNRVTLAGRRVRVVGATDRYLTGTGFEITPVLGMIPPDLPLRANPAEVESWFEVPLATVLDPAKYDEQSALWRGAERRYYELHHEGYRIWGVTAAILLNLSRRLQLTELFDD